MKDLTNCITLFSVIQNDLEKMSKIFQLAGMDKMIFRRIVTASWTNCLGTQQDL